MMTPESALEYAKRRVAKLRDGAKPLVLYSVAAGVHYVIVAPSGEMLSTGCNGSVDAAWLDACTYLLKPRLVEYLL
jgi:hypothetical protein